VAKDSTKLNIATFLRWYEPDQVQRDQENLSQPVGTPSGLPINLCLTYHIFWKIESVMGNCVLTAFLS